MKKMHAIIIGSIIITSLLCSVLFINGKIGGDRLVDTITQIRIVKGKTGKNILRIEYGWSAYEKAKYSVRTMDEGEALLLPDGLLPDNGGSLGEYRIEIMLTDVRRSEQLYNEYPSKSVHKLKDVPSELNSKINIRIVCPSDDSKLIIYIGSDEPIKIKEQDSTTFYSIKGRIDLILEN